MAQLDLLDGVVPVACPARDLDPVLLEHVRHRLDDGRVVVRDEAGRHSASFSHESPSARFARAGPDDIGSRCQRATGVE